MKFEEHVALIPEAVEKTFLFKHTFYPLPQKTRRVFIVGSGSSFSQSIYLNQLFFDYLPYPSIYLNPYSFVKYSNFSNNDICIHFTQEAKRNDNICPLEFAKKNGGRTILFTSIIDHQNSINKIADEIYWFAPETEKILVASMSYMSGYAVALKYINAQLFFLGLGQIKYNMRKIIRIMGDSLKIKYKTEKSFTVFLYSGYAQSIAAEGALKVNECCLRDSEAYELKHYSHGKHFVSYNNDRLYNVLCSGGDKQLISLYKKSIFEKHHKFNIMDSALGKELAVFEWGTKMLSFVAQDMKRSNIKLVDIPIREKIRWPHDFKY